MDGRSEPIRQGGDGVELGKQRVLAAVEHRTTDRVPITFDAVAEVYDALYRHFGIESKEALFDRLNVDTWMILPGNFKYLESEQGKIEKTSVWGYRTRVTQYSGGSYDELVHSPLAGRDGVGDIGRHRWPAPETFDFSHFPAEAEAHRDRAVIGVFTHGAFHVACYLRGMENLMIDFATRKDYARHLLEKISEVSLAALGRLLESHGCGIDIIYMCDDYCSQAGPLFSPSAFGEFVAPYLRQAVAKAHRHGKRFLLHVCGSVRALLPMIIDSGVDMLEPVQTRARGMEPAGLKRDFGKHLCFYGGVDLQRVLSSGSPQRVADEVKRLVDVLGRDGGYVLGPSHTYIQVDAPVENIIAMYETAASCRTQ